MIRVSARRFQLGVASIVACAGSLAYGAPQAPPVVITPSIIDFGRVAPGSRHRAAFEIVNTGSAPVTIKSVVPSCKCTDVNQLAGTMIASGSKAILEATLDVPTTPGEKDAKVFLTFEGYAQPMMALMKADASLPIRATPAFVDALKKVSGGTILVTSEDRQPFTVVSAGGVAPVFEGFNPATDAPRASYTLKWNAPTSPCESMPLWWIVETDRPDCPLIALRIRHECTGSRADPTKADRFWFFPEPIVVAGRVPSGQSVSVPIVIEHYNSTGRGAVVRPDWSQVKSVKSLSPSLVASLEGTRPGNREDVAVLLKVSPAPGVDGLIYALVEVETASGTGSFAVVMQVPKVDGAR